MQLYDILKIRFGCVTVKSDLQNVSIFQKIYLIFICKDERKTHLVAINSKADFLFDIIAYTFMMPVILFFCFFKS